MEVKHYILMIPPEKSRLSRTKVTINFTIFFTILVICFTALSILRITVLHSMHAENDAKKRLVCYYNFPRNKDDLQPQGLDPFLCTHIIVAFANVVNNEIQVTDENIRIMEEIAALKANNTDLKVLISVGGAGNLDGFPEMVLNHANRKKFIRSVFQFWKATNTDGIDLDWEFPNKSGGNFKQKMHFTQLLEEFRHHINKHEKNYILSLAMPSPVNLIDSSYDVLYDDEFVDFINLMTYDYHFFSALTPFTGINSPLFGSAKDKGVFTTMNINYTLNYLLEKGLRKEKINIGLPVYGHSFTLFNELNNGLFAPASGYGHLGTNGFVGYGELCKFLSNNKVNLNFENDTMSPYFYKNLEWVSYDDEKSLSLKTKFLVKNDFGGAMVYSLNVDDFKGMCSKNSTKFSLVRSVKKALANQELLPKILLA